MAQYDPIVLPATGIAQNLGANTAHADRTAVAAMTTTGLASGDAVQVSGAMTLTPALYNSTAPVVGVYDGESGSVVREGVVVATMQSGVVLAAGDAVYVSKVAGKLTNVKPTNDVLHEVGLVVDASQSKILLQQKPPVVLPATTMFFDARSPWLLQGSAPPTEPGERQPFPATAAALIAAMGSPPGVTAANITAIYAMDTASPLVDSLGLGPNLVAAGGPLTGRECCGLPDTSFVSKVGVECVQTSANRFASADGSFADVNGNVVAYGCVFRSNSSAADGGLVCKSQGTGWYTSTNGGNIRLYVTAGPGTILASVPAAYDGSWHCLFAVIDGTTNTGVIYSDLGDNTTGAAWPGAITSLADFLTVGANIFFGTASAAQFAYLFFCNVALTSAMRASFWRAFNLNAFGTPASHTRANPITVPITASRVACYGANQPAVGYGANASAGTNPLRSSLVCEDGITFEPIGSTDFYGNSSVIGGATARTSVDGASGMRDAIRVTMGAAWGTGWAFIPNPAGVAIVAPSNVAWRADVNYRRGVVNTTARMGLYFQGGGGGPETFTLVADAASPVDWVRGGGTCTPVGAAHNQVYQVFGAAANLDDCEHAEPALVKNRATAPIAWRRVGTAAAAATSTLAHSYTNVGNARYLPARGRLTVRFSDFARKDRAYLAAVGVGDQPRGCCYAPDGHVWVCNANANTITKIRTSDNSVIGTYATGNQPYGCCYDPLQNYIWVGCYNGGGASVITVLNAATGAFVATRSSGVAGGALGPCYANGSIWVNNYGAASVTKLNAITGAVIGTYAVAGNNRDPVYDGTSIWVVNDNTNNVTQLTEATGAFVRNVATGLAPIFSCFDGTFIWTCNWSGNSLTKINAATGGVVGTYAVPTQPQGIVFDGEYLFVNSQNTATMTQVNPATGAVVNYYRGMFAGGSLLVGLCYDGRNLWVTDLNNDSAVKIGYGQVFTAFGAEAAQGALWLDYSGDVAFNPLLGTAPQLRLRLWDDAAALVSDLDCGALTAAELEANIEWSAALGTITVRNGAGTLLAARSASAWTPEPLDVTPLYLGSDPTPANSACCNLALVQLTAL